MRELKFSDISQKTPDMYSASSVYIGSVSKRADQEPQQFPTIEPFLLLSPFSPRWFSLHRGFFLPSTGGFLQSVGASARQQAAQRPKTSTHWNNHPAYKPSRVQIPPASGRIRPLAAHSKSRNRHLLEQSPRLQAIQSPDSSSQWENPPAGSSLKVQKPPLTGTITPLTSHSASQSFQ